MGKIIAIIVVVAAVGGYFLMKKSPSPAMELVPSKQTEQSMTKEIDGPLREFSMTAYYDAQGKWFSLKDIAVKKGDHVRIKVTNTAGMHDFTLDEFGVKQELPLNQEVVIDFVADQVGSFQYYCSKPGHRAAGQWGALTVSE